MSEDNKAETVEIVSNFKGFGVTAKFTGPDGVDYQRNSEYRANEVTTGKITMPDKTVINVANCKEKTVLARLLCNAQPKLKGNKNTLSINSYGVNITFPLECILESRYSD